MSIRVITEPRVYLVGRQTVDEAALQAFLEANDVESWETDTDVAAEKIVETAGRVCYMSFAKPRPGGNRAYLGHILEVGHGSVVEHAVFNLLIEGVSRSLTHELIRHRAGFGYSQLSQRFVDESGAEFVIPPEYRDEVMQARGFISRVVGRPNAGALDVSPDMRNTNRKMITPTVEAGLTWLIAMETARQAYADLSEYGMKKLAAIEDKTATRKRARESARSVLPNATETKIFVTGNVRALRHFITARGGPEADAEIRRLAVKIARVLIDEAPNLFQDVAIWSHGEAGEVVVVSHPKV